MECSPSFFNAIDTLFLVLDPEGRIQIFNEVCQEVTGYSFEEVWGCYVWDQFFSTQEKHFMMNLFQQVKHPPYRNTYENLWITKDGRFRLISFTNAAVVEDSAVRHICVTGIDITQNRRMTEELWKYRILLEEQVNERTAELRASQARFSGILEISESAIVSTDEQQKILIFNQGAEMIFGYSAREVLGKSLSILLPERFRNAHGNYIRQFDKSPILSRSMSERSEIIGRRKDGGEFFAEATISKLRISGETIYTAMLQDITERRQIEKELREAKDQAEASNRAKTQFLANMSHEIRTPLNSIVGLSQILLRRSRSLNLPREHLEFLEDIRVSGDNLSELINNLLDLSKIEAGKLEARLDAVNLRVLVQAIYQIHKVQAVEKDVHFRYRVGTEVPVMLQSDRTMLNQILMNLVGNAIKFTPPDKEVLLELDVLADQLLIRVHDQGIGISAEHFQSIFEPFEQADNSITRGFGGSGLGLAITQRMVRSLRGEIELQSEVGQGTSFLVRLPLHSGSATAPGLPEEAGTLQFDADNHVLLVEDNHKNRRMMQALFEDLGLPLEIASDGQAALDYVQQRRPDLVLMDMHMPGMDGLETTRLLHQLKGCAEVPVVILSADAFLPEHETTLQAGIADYLTKPLDFRKLFPILQRYLRCQAAGSPLSLESLKLSEPCLLPATWDKLGDLSLQLERTPVFLSDEIVQQVHQMLKLLGPAQNPLRDTLEQIEQAVYNRASQHIPGLLEQLQQHFP